jgi:penicillin-binding protein 1A
MEKVYHDPSTGYSYGPFPKAEVKIDREYNCVTPRYKVDTIATDSTLLDSLAIPDSVIIEEPVIQEEIKAVETPKDQVKTTTTAPIKTETAAPTDKKTRREQRREERRRRQQEQNN